MVPQECIKPVKVEQKSGRGVIRIEDDGGAEALAAPVMGTPAPELLLLLFVRFFLLNVRIFIIIVLGI